MAEPYYATVAELRSKVGVEEAMLPEEEAVQILTEAEDLTDERLGVRPIDEDTGRKVVPAEEDAWRIAKVTGESNYQGLFIPAQKPIGSAVLSRVNIKAGSAHRGKLFYLLGFGSGEGPYGLPKCNPYPMSLDRCYADPNGSGKSLQELVFPDPGSEGEINGEMHQIGAESDDGWASCYWPAITQIKGRVIYGPPPGGDFCTTADCGIGYVSPGYV